MTVARWLRRRSLELGMLLAALIVAGLLLTGGTRGIHGTATPAPSPTTTASGPLFATVEASGTGDAIVTLPAHQFIPLVLEATYSGAGGTFRVVGDDQTLVATDRPYTGTVPLDLRNDQETLALTVTAGGPWRIEVRQLFGGVGGVPAGGTASGAGDLVYFFEGDTGTATIACVGTGPFSVRVASLYSGQLFEAAAATGRYLGTSGFEGHSLVIVTADGPWTIDVN